MTNYCILPSINILRSLIILLIYYYCLFILTFQHYNIVIAHLVKQTMKPAQQHNLITTLITKVFKKDIFANANTSSSDQQQQLLAQIQTIQEQDQEDQFEELFLNIRNQSHKNKLPDSDSPIKKIQTDNAKMGLITQIDIWSDKRLRAGDLWKYLTIYYYEKPNKPLFGETSETIQKNYYYCTTVLLDTFSQFQSEDSHKHEFYLLTKDLTVLFNSYQQQKFVLLYSKDSEALGALESLGIHQHGMIVEGTNNHVSLIKSRSIRLFWNWIMGQLLIHNMHFQIVSNFRFSCSQQRLPMEVYNGKQGKTDKNKEYHIKMEGFFFQQNIQNLKTKNAKDSYTISLKTFDKTSKFQNIVSQAINYQKSTSEDSSCSDAESDSSEDSQHLI